MTVRITILIPTFDRPQKLARALKSCIEQTSPADEILIVDNGSNPETEPTVERFKSTFGAQGTDMRYTKSEPFNARKALAKGIGEVTGEWIIQLDDDDLLFPERVEHDRQILQTVKSNVIMLVNNFVRVDFNSDLVWLHKFSEKPLGLYQALCLDSFSPPPSTTLKAEVVKAYHSYNEAGGCTDFDLYASILDHGVTYKTGHQGYIMDDTRVTGRLSTNLEHTLNRVKVHRERFRSKHELCQEGHEAVVNRLRQQEAFYTGKVLGLRCFLNKGAAVWRHPIEAFKGVLSPIRGAFSRFAGNYLPEMRGSKTYSLKRLKETDPNLYTFINRSRLEKQ